MVSYTNMISPQDKIPPWHRYRLLGPGASNSCPRKLSINLVAVDPSTRFKNQVCLERIAALRIKEQRI